MNDGELVSLGGIYLSKEVESSSGLPILKDIPFLGALFRSKSKQRDRRELLIFITPRIVK